MIPCVSDLHTIIERDYDKNHSHRTYDSKYMCDIFDKYVELGGNFFHSGSVIINYGLTDNGICEFHCINGGDGKELVDTIHSFFSRLHAPKAVTFYDNPRINEISKYCRYPTVITKIDQGADRTYRMEFDLRS